MKIKIKRSLAVVLFLLLNVASMTAEEITLFNSSGTPTAYIDTEDEDLTIYMWNGLPVAYLTTAEDNGYHIYGFNGNHLGWLENGIIRSHSGYAMGFRKGAIEMYTSYEPYKGYKQIKPLKSLKQLPPYKPLYINSFSTESLALFLIRGANSY